MEYYDSTLGILCGWNVVLELVSFGTDLLLHRNVEPPDDPIAVEREEAMEREIEGVEMDRAREQALDEEKRKPKKRRKEKEMMSQVNSPPQEEDLRV